MPCLAHRLAVPSDGHCEEPAAPSPACGRLALTLLGTLSCCFLTSIFLITHELGQLGVFACFKKAFSPGNVPLFYLFGHTIQ